MSGPGLVLGAFFAGLGRVVRAPLLIAGLCLVTMAAAAPFGLMLGASLRTALAAEAPVSGASGDIDPEWWAEFLLHAKGLERTFTPTVIGFAAPLDNLSALADGDRRPLVLAVPLAIYGLLWACLWGGVLTRFAGRRATGLRAFWRSAFTHAPAFVGISVLAAALQCLLYLTLHRWLFGPVFDWAAGLSATEDRAFAARVGLYLVFGAFVAVVSVTADYARVAAVFAGGLPAGRAVRAGARFVTARPGAVAALFLMTGALFVVVFAGYGTLEVVGGLRVGGGRGVLLGQLFVLARLAIRLLFAATEVELFRRAGLAAAARQPVSLSPVNPGPPAAT